MTQEQTRALSVDDERDTHDYYNEVLAYADSITEYGDGDKWTRAILEGAPKPLTARELWKISEWWGTEARAALSGDPPSKYEEVAWDLEQIIWASRAAREELGEDATPEDTMARMEPWIVPACGVLVYYRRSGLDPFPVRDVDDVEVLTPAEYAEEYGGRPDTYGTGWEALECEADDIECALGLDGYLTEVVLWCDAVYISVAIHRHLGLPLRPWEEDEWFRRCDMDDHEDEYAELYYFGTIRELYGAEAEAAARRQYAREGV